LLHNAFGRRLVGSDCWREFGAEPGVAYRLALTVVGMGDTNAVDVATQTHRRNLMHFGCLRGDEELVYGDPFPIDAVEGVYIDDHFILRVVWRRELSACGGRDWEVIEASHQAYVAGKFPRAPEKGFGFSAQRAPGETPRADTRFVVIGTEVQGEVGIVGTPLRKRAELALLTGALVRLPRVTV